MLAEAYRKMGLPQEASAAADDALEYVEATGERFYEAELYRLKGSLDAEGEAAAYFLKALEVARQQKARSFELRLAASFVHLRQQQVIESEPADINHNRALLKEAQALLSDIYNSFTEGFDSADFQEARELLTPQ
jgi:hypothetical protein